MKMFDLCSMWIKADEILKESGGTESALHGLRHRQVFCDLLLDELKKLRGRDLEPFLGESTANVYTMSYKLELLIPFSKIRNGATTISELETDSEGDGNAPTV